MLNHQYSAALLHVLIIEDVEDDALLLVDHLQSGGLEFDWQRVDTEQAMTAKLQDPWDIILSDYAMPRFSGMRALEIVRQRHLDVPFIFISGTIGEENAVEAMKRGAQDYVMKSNMARLLPVINRELRESRQRQGRRQADRLVQKLSLVIKQTTDSVFIIDTAGRIEYVNPAFEKLTGYSAAEIISKPCAILWSGEHDADFYRQLWKTVHNGETFTDILISRRKNGTLFHEEKVITPIKDEQRRITHFVSTGRDITARVQAEEARTQLAAILKVTPDLVATLELDGRLRFLNAAGRRLLGLDVEEDVRRHYLQEFFIENVAQLVAEACTAVYQPDFCNEELTLRTAGGDDVSVSPVILAHRGTTGEIEYLSIIARDISERKRFEVELQRQATHDHLTELPNRFFLIDRFTSALQYARRHSNVVAVLFLDMNNFKRVNDSLGHAAGDALLQQVARRLQGCLRSNDTVARHGGDEFTIVAGELNDPEKVYVMLRKLHVAFEHPMIVNLHEVYVTFSIGIALYPHDGERIEDLLRYADIAMYRAKRAGPNQYCFYASNMNDRSRELLTLEADLQHALAHKEFLLHYQPQVNLRRGRVAGIEGLLRWQHSVRGLMSPADFIPLLENSGMIVSVGEWVLRQACKAHRSLRKSGFDDIRVSINVSAAQFNDTNLLDKVRRALQEEQMPRQALELEITENILMPDPVVAAEVLQAIHALGARIAIDDFGTGYSSLGYLKRFPLDVLKIDKTFVGDLENDSGDAAIVEASISLAHKLGLEVIAEGVETLQQLEFMHTHWCDMVQGYYLSRPLPESELTKSLQKKWRSQG